MKKKKKATNIRRKICEHKQKKNIENFSNLDFASCRRFNVKIRAVTLGFAKWKDEGNCYFEIIVNIRSSFTLSHISLNIVVLKECKYNPKSLVPFFKCICIQNRLRYNNSKYSLEMFLCGFILFLFFIFVETLCRTSDGFL